MIAGGQLFEESPDSNKARCRVMPGGGNPRDSATEKRQSGPARIMVKRWGQAHRAAGNRRGTASPTGSNAK